MCNVAVWVAQLVEHLLCSIGWPWFDPWFIPGFFSLPATLVTMSPKSVGLSDKTNEMCVGQTEEFQILGYI